jgi:NAD(P)-dependent dehydrogenase (short-subunit alcohol dehydrogenase family)
VAKTWFITGASSGFGREWAIAALERGDRVAAAARTVPALQELARRFGEEAVLPIELDVSDRAASFAAVAHARDRFGRLDVIANCAGGGHHGTIEELDEPGARRVMDVNFFGTLWVTQAALPVLREQGGGHILMVSSIGGLVSNQTLGMYHATKWAVEAMSEALSKEVDQFGIKVTILEPTGYRTGAATNAGRSTPLPAYAREAAWMEERRAFVVSREGDPTATREAVLKVVDSEHPPLRLLLGAFLHDFLETTYRARLEELRAWEDVSVAAHGPLPSPTA